MNGVTILKSSDKFLVFACDDEAHGRCVYKIAQRDNDVLHREVATLLALKERSARIAPHLPAVYEYGTFPHGAYGGQAYYKQAHIDGRTFSQCIQHTLTADATVDALFPPLMRSLVEIALDDVGMRWSERATDTLRRVVLDEYEQLSRRPHIAPLSRADGLVVNGRHHPPLRASVDVILASPAFAALDAAAPFLATLGHWNFHGDNVLLTGGDHAGFGLIDPDVTWTVADPLLSVARFLYTFPHDTADYRQYVLQTDFLTALDDALPEVQVTLLWPEAVAQSYRRLFGPFFACADEAGGAPADRLLTTEQRFRLRLALLLCLLRGINANYEDEIEFFDRRIDAFRNKSVFLFLRTTEFASVLAASVEGAAV